MSHKIKENKENQKMVRRDDVEVGEDSTKYGEFVSSYFAWIPLPEQKEKAKRLENITKKENEEKERKDQKKLDKKRK